MTRADTFIVMELLSGGELFNRIVEQGRFTEANAAALFAQILLSMEYLHSLNIVHRDVKPENILYVKEGSQEIKLIDFGCVRVRACMRADAWGCAGARAGDGRTNERSHRRWPHARLLSCAGTPACGSPRSS